MNGRMGEWGNEGMNGGMGEWGNGGMPGWVVVREDRRPADSAETLEEDLDIAALVPGTCVIRSILATKSGKEKRIARFIKIRRQ